MEAMPASALKPMAQPVLAGDGMAHLRLALSSLFAWLLASATAVTYLSIVWLLGLGLCVVAPWSWVLLCTVSRLLCAFGPGHPWLHIVMDPGVVTAMWSAWYAWYKNHDDVLQLIQSSTYLHLEIKQAQIQSWFKCSRRCLMEEARNVEPEISSESNASASAHSTAQHSSSPPLYSLSQDLLTTIFDQLDLPQRRTLQLTSHHLRQAVQWRVSTFTVDYANAGRASVASLQQRFPNVLHVALKPGIIVRKPGALDPLLNVFATQILPQFVKAHCIDMSALGPKVKQASWERFIESCPATATVLLPAMATNSHTKQAADTNLTGSAAQESSLGMPEQRRVQWSLIGGYIGGAQLAAMLQARKPGVVIRPGHLPANM